MIKIGILTISDKGSRGERYDKSGEVLRDFVARLKGEVVKYEIIPDEKEVITESLKFMVDKLRCDLVLTTGGTGISLRDLTPEATKDIIDKEIPGLTEMMRMQSFENTPTSLLSRAIAGIRKQSLIVNLPGSPKGVKECMDIILPALIHGVEILKGEVTECASYDMK